MSPERGNRRSFSELSAGPETSVALAPPDYYIIIYNYNEINPSPLGIRLVCPLVPRSTLDRAHTKVHC